MNIKAVASPVYVCDGCIFLVGDGSIACALVRGMGLPDCAADPGYVYGLSTPVPGLSAKIERLNDLPGLYFELRRELRGLNRDLVRTVR